ncbi:unnamed protein product [Thlaspi arvense]|uniref:Uncharacterized protein n=1 Tax=Thlaspi arvense TaxID=13288 RepID=A0AAU9SI05_THLAR|nr:unnamed protein product [Thlaspi arvense]
MTMIMNLRNKVKVASIEKCRKKIFKKNAKAVMKKLYGLFKLCNGKPCVIVFPGKSRGGGEKVLSKFMELLYENLMKKVLIQKIAKVKKQVQTLREANLREYEKNEAFCKKYNLNPEMFWNVSEEQMTDVGDMSSMNGKQPPTING